MEILLWMVVIWVGFILIGFLLGLAIWWIVNQFRSGLDPVGFGLLGGILTTVAFVGLWILAAIQGAPRNAYRAAYAKEAVITCKSTVDYAFDIEFEDHALPAEMLVRWATISSIEDLRWAAKEDAKATHRESKADCDALLRTKGHSANYDYYRNNRYKMAKTLY